MNQICPDSVYDPVNVKLCNGQNGGRSFLDQSADVDLNVCLGDPPDETRVALCEGGDGNGEVRSSKVVVMTEKMIGFRLACKPMLSGPSNLIAGYEAFHDQEGRYTQIALREMPDAAAIWYRYLTLFDHTLRGELESPSLELDDKHRAWDLRLRLASVACATAKLALDAALAGYYSQAFALLRHMLETWQQMVYVRFNPIAAELWFSPDGVKPPREPGTSTIVNKLRGYAKGDMELANNVAIVEKQIRHLHKGAHPSAMVVGQAAAKEPGWLYLGAKFDRRYLANVTSNGTLAMALLLHEIAHSVPVDDAWREEFNAIGKTRSRWHEGVHFQ